MVNSVSIRAQCRGESNLTIPFLLSDLGSGEEHVARLANLSRFGLFRRWDDLLDEGVAAVFGLASGAFILFLLAISNCDGSPVRRGLRAGGRSSPERLTGLHGVVQRHRLACKKQGEGILKTREERREELKRLAARPNGIDKLYSILTRNFIPFEKLPIETGEAGPGDLPYAGDQPSPTPSHFGKEGQ